MTSLNENFSKELQRMSELAGIPKNSITERATEIIKEEKKESKKLLKEDEDDIFGEIGDLLNDEEKALSFKSAPSPDLTKEEKASLVLNMVSQYDAAILGISGEYESETSGAKPEAEGGTQGTVVAKEPIQKLPGATKAYNSLSRYGDLTPDKIKQLTDSGVSQSDIDAAIEADKKIKMSAVSHGKVGGDVQTARWQPKAKDERAIAYDTTIEGGKKLVKLSDKGKKQLEFLQRMLSERPLPISNDEDIDIETVLVNPGFKYKNLVVTNAEHIIRRFYGKSIVPILSQTFKRNTKSPDDSQFVMFLETGIDHAIDKTKGKKYNQDLYNNFGAWFMQVVKNKSIDELKKISDFRLDNEFVNDRLYHMTGPLVIDSKLNPEEALLGNYKTSISKYKWETDSGEEKPYFSYIFQEPIDARGLFGEKFEGGKKSPFQPRFLRNPSDFYKSFLKEKPDTLTKTTYEPGEGGAVEQQYYEGVPAREVINLANTEIDNILDEIYVEIFNSSEVNKGESIRIIPSRFKEFLSKPTTRRDVYQNLDITGEKTYQVIKKESHKSTFLYIIKDDAGKKIGLSQRYAKPVKGIVSTSSLLTKKVGEQYKVAIIEILRNLLQYGQMIPQYNKVVFIPAKDESGVITWKEKRPYDQKTKTGSNVVKSKNGKLFIPYKSENLNDRYESLNASPITYVWDSSQTQQNAEKIIKQIQKVAVEKNIELPPNLPEFVVSLRSGLRKFFGFRTLTTPSIQKDRDLLNDLLKNYQKTKGEETLEENHIRKIVRQLMLERTKKNN